MDEKTFDTTQPAALKELTDFEKEIIAQQYDNEFIKYLCELSKNKSTKDIAKFIEENQWTDRQKKTIMAYARIVLGDGLSTTYFMNNNDYRMLYDDKALIDCDLPLGMTVFDMTPEFNILIGLINLHFGIESRKSKGALFIKRIGTQRHELVSEELVRKQQGLQDKIINKDKWY